MYDTSIINRQFEHEIDLKKGENVTKNGRESTE